MANLPVTKTVVGYDNDLNMSYEEFSKQYQDLTNFLKENAIINYAIVTHALCSKDKIEREKYKKYFEFAEEELQEMIENSKLNRKYINKILLKTRIFMFARLLFYVAYKN